MVEAATGGYVSNKAEPGHDLVPLGNVAIYEGFRGGSEVIPKSGTAVFPSKGDCDQAGPFASTLTVNRPNSGPDEKGIVTDGNLEPQTGSGCWSE